MLQAKKLPDGSIMLRVPEGHELHEQITRAVGETGVLKYMNPNHLGKGPHGGQFTTSSHESASDANKEVESLARELTDNLEMIARARVDQYQAGTVVGAESMLDYHARRTPEMREHFEPIRKKLRELYGDTVTLYRGADTVGGVPGKFLSSYALDKRVAAKFMEGWDVDGNPLPKVMKEDKVPIEAVFMVVRTKDRPLEFMVQNSILEGSAETLKYAHFNPDEARGEHGRWTAGGAHHAEPFYSRLERAINALGNKPIPVEAVKNRLKKSGEGFSEDEWEWSGMDDALEGKKEVTREELQKHFEENQTRVDDVILGEEVSDGPVTWEKDASNPNRLNLAGPGGFFVQKLHLSAPDDKTSWNYGYMHDDRRDVILGTRSTLDEAKIGAVNAFRNDKNRGKQAKWEEFQTPGGKNYREMLLTLPPVGAPEPLTKLPADYESAIDRHTFPKTPWFILPPGQTHAKAFGQHYATEEEARAAALKTVNENRHAEWLAVNTYHHAHWSGVENPLLHVRFNDREQDGEKILHVEEVQSDWHQTIRDEGVKGQTDRSKMSAKMVSPGDTKDMWEVTYPDGSSCNVVASDEKEALDRGIAIREAKMVPDAPFKETWPELALKKIIRYACEHGYDRITLNKGEQINKVLGDHEGSLPGQARFYSSELPAEEIGKMIYNNAKKVLWSNSSAAKSTLDKWDTLDRETKEFCVKEAGDKGKLTNTEKALLLGGKTPEQVGEKIKSDRVLPNVMAKLGKPFGAKVEEFSLRGIQSLDEKLGEEVEQLTEKRNRLDVNPTKPDELRKHQEYNDQIEKLIEKRHSIRRTSDEFVGSMPVTSLKITPEMRESVMSKGLALYGRDGEVLRYEKTWDGKLRPIRYVFDPNEARNAQGEWTMGAAHAAVKKAQEQDASDDEVVDAEPINDEWHSGTYAEMPMLEADFNVGGRDYKWKAIDHGNGVWETDFRSDRGAGLKINPTGSIKDTFEILRNVSDRLRRLVREKNPKKIQFSADASEPSRVKLYDHLVKKIAAASNYRVGRNEGHKYVDYELICKSGKGHVEDTVAGKFERDGEPLQYVKWDEGEHPRGQPKNKGQFVKRTGPKWDAAAKKKKADAAWKKYKAVKKKHGVPDGQDGPTYDKWPQEVYDAREAWLTALHESHKSSEPGLEKRVVPPAPKVVPLPYVPASELPEQKPFLDYQQRDAENPTAKKIKGNLAAAAKLQRWMDETKKDREQIARFYLGEKMHEADRDEVMRLRLKYGMKTDFYDDMRKGRHKSPIKDYPPEVMAAYDKYLDSISTGYSLSKLHDSDVEDLKKKLGDKLLDILAMEDRGEVTGRVQKLPYVNLPVLGKLELPSSGEDFSRFGEKDQLSLFGRTIVGLDELHPNVQKSFNIAKAKIEKIIGPSCNPDVLLTYDIYALGRAYYRDTTKELNIGHHWQEDDPKPFMIDDTADAMVHELGHAVESQTPGMLEKSIAFLEYRLQGEEPTNLADVSSAYGGVLAKWLPTFMGAEFGRKDDFEKAVGGGVAPYYVGKVYERGLLSKKPFATEVISVGLEYMLRDPVRFIENDPEYAHFLVGALQS